MRTTVNMTFTIDSDVSIEALIQLIETVGARDIATKSIPHYEDWLASLPKEAIPGLSDACLDWIHNWGTGGGDQSSETMIIEAISKLSSDVPEALADAIYGSVADYSKSDFDAMQLAMEMIDGCLDDIEEAKFI